ncbi:sialidase family protein [Maridesulfovibrio bastinii]|uniref:sialidase family protein n=1 Tax=Maridesulfovibrio bastinii TaxID=47157 RepID=UPI000480129C|nr:sialidase family protein [Maridesulfovibrio bastinii]
MPELSEDRLQVIDHRPGHYLCFPDVIKTADNQLMVVYSEFDRHAGTRRKLLLKTSSNYGESWRLPRVLRSAKAHCPRLNLLSDGHIMCVDDDCFSVLWSLDNGLNFSENACSSFSQHMIPSHVVELDTDTFLMTGHTHRGSQPLSLLRQPPSEQMVYISHNRGNDWQQYSIMAYEKDLVLCEADMVRLPDGDILAVLRENSFVYEPMYAVISRDDGKSWSDPVPTCLIGHRPSIGLTSDGDLLLTYRNCGPDGGTCAWKGSLKELLSGFKVHGRSPAEDNPVFTAEGMRIITTSPENAVRYALRPMTNPARATASLEIEVRVDRSDIDGSAVHFGGWWKILSDKVIPAAEEGSEAAPIYLEADKFHSFKFLWNKGECQLLVDGNPVYQYEFDPFSASSRPILFGCASVDGENRCDTIWKSVRLEIREPDRDRNFEWAWKFSDGRPDNWLRHNVLELANDRNAAFGDYGYSGWTETAPGEFYAVWHHGGSVDASYIKGRSSRILGTTMYNEDFKK